MCVDHTHQLLPPSHSQWCPIPSLTQIHVLFWLFWLLIIPKIQLMLTICIWVCGHPLGHMQPILVAPKEGNFPYLSSHHLSIAPPFSVGPWGPHPTHAGMLTVSWCVQQPYHAPKLIFLSFPLHLQALTFSPSPLPQSPWALDDGRLM